MSRSQNEEPKAENASEAPWLLELKQRGLVHDFSDEERLRELPVKSGFYVGFDPTAPSLQLGNLVPLIVTIHLAKAGFRPFILFGGATGSIGDPSGKDKERSLLPKETIEKNISVQQRQVELILDRHNLTAEFVNNFDWTRDVSMLEFLRDVGKHFTVNYMTAKEVVRSRLEGHGISYTEFSYMLLQAFDFDYLYREHGVRLQFGGSDQWGNITAGLELIRRKGTGEAVAFSFPLLTNSEGKKFGKSEDGAIWLDAKLTSPYRLHQFLFNVEDADVIRYLRVLSFLSLEEINEIEKQHSSSPEKRIPQERLADELVTLVHGSEAVESANRSRAVLFGGSLEGVSESDLVEIFEGVPSSNLPKADALKMSLVDVFASCALVGSKGEAKRLFSQGGAYVNNARVDDPQQLLGDCSVLFDSITVLRSGKKKYHLLRLT